MKLPIPNLKRVRKGKVLKTDWLLYGRWYRCINPFMSVESYEAEGWKVYRVVKKKKLTLRRAK